MYPKVILKGIFCVLPDNFFRFAWQATAVGGSVSGLVIDVQTGKAVGAVVAVVGSRSLRGAYPAAYLAGKGLIAGFVSVVLVIFRIMLHISSKRLSFGRRMTYAVK